MKTYASGAYLVPGLLVLMVTLTVNLGPLALGSNRPLPWAYNALLAGLLLVVTASWQMVQVRYGSRISFRPVALPLLFFILVISWTAVQTMNLPAGSLPNPIWTLAADMESTISNHSISVNLASSGTAAMRFLTYLSVFLSVYLLALNAVRASFFLWAFVVSACSFAIYGLVRYAIQWNKILWYESVNNSVLTGPFINQNNAATYFGMALVGALALLLHAIRQTERSSRHSSYRYKIIFAIQDLPGRAGIALILFMILLVAILLTGSRAGIVASICGCLTLVILRLLRQGRKSGYGAIGFAGVAIVFILTAVVFELSGARFAERILAADANFGGRFEVYRMSWASVIDNAAFGTGLGTFQDVFPVYRDDTLTYGLTWDKAHNDYLELFLGLGIPAALLFLLALSMLFVTVVKGYFRRRRDSIYCGVAASVTILVSLHSMVDFSLQIQAVAMTFAMLLGLGAAQSQSSQSG